MSQLWVGLAGVVVGGFVTGLASWLVDVSRSRRARRREFRRAARLVQEELYEDLCVLRNGVEEQRHWWTHPEDQLRTARWDEYASVFADADVSDELWGEVACSYQMIRELNGSARARAGKEEAPFSDRDEEDLRISISSIDDGRRALVGLVRGAPYSVEPDPVMALENAARKAAIELAPGSIPPRGTFEQDDELLVVSEDHPVIGVALLAPPQWVSFECTIPLDELLIVSMPSIPGSRACVAEKRGFPKGPNSWPARLYVPEEIRSHPDYTDFSLLLRLPGDGSLVSRTENFPSRRESIEMIVRATPEDPGIRWLLEGRLAASRDRLTKAGDKRKA
jgi:hypothetical protein